MSEGHQIIQGVAPLDGYTLNADIYAQLPDHIVLLFYKSEGADPVLVSFLSVILTNSVNTKSDVELNTLHLPNQLSFPRLVAHRVQQKSASGRTFGTLELTFERGSMSFSFEQAFSLLRTKAMKVAMSEQELSNELARQTRELPDG